MQEKVGSHQGDADDVAGTGTVGVVGDKAFVQEG